MSETMQTLTEAINEWVSGDGRSMSINDYLGQLEEAREELEMLINAAKEDEEV
jgi:hypothetical protein